MWGCSWGGGHPHPLPFFPSLHRGVLDPHFGGGCSSLILWRRDLGSSSWRCPSRSITREGIPGWGWGSQHSGLSGEWIWGPPPLLSPPVVWHCTGGTGVGPPVTPQSCRAGIWSPQLEVGPQHCDPLEKECAAPNRGCPPTLLSSGERDMGTPVRGGTPKHCDPLEKGPGHSSWSWASPALGEGICPPPQRDSTALGAEGYGDPNWD